MARILNWILCFALVIPSTYILGFEIPRSSLKSFSSDGNSDVPELSHNVITEQRISENWRDTQGKHASHPKRKRINVHSKSRREMPVEPENEDDGPKISPKCKNSLYCEEVLNYPQQEVENMKPTLPKGINLQIEKLDHLDFDQRVLGVEDVQFCDAPEKIVYPQMSVDYDGNKLYVYNTKDETVRQGFRVQECKEVDCKCNQIIVGLQDGYRGRCKQFNIYRSAAVFKSSQNISVFQTQIKLPGYCACVAEPCTKDPGNTNLPKCDVESLISTSPE